VRAWRIPYSTNCERLSLAAGATGLSLEWIDVDAYDRSPVVEVSGQPRVPVAEIDGEIVVGSLEIIGRVAPGLWPPDPRARAQVDVFLQWFERVWLHPIGILWTESTDDARLARAGSRLERSADTFEALLDGPDFLFGSLTVADIAAYPFLKYATDDANPEDDYEIHHLMRRHQSTEGRPRLAAWIDRVSALPHA
jgi:glutathione S-transferase